MDKSFRDQWLASVDRSNSVLVAGLDPADFEMGRGAKGLPEGVSKRDWSLQYVEAVAPHIAGLKPNENYWKGEGDREVLMEVVELAYSLNLPVVLDAKFADIGETNDAGMFFASRAKKQSKTEGKGRIHAVTIAPYAGNMAAAANSCHKFGLGTITMCLMSNSEYAREKLALMPIPEAELSEYDREDVTRVGDTAYVHRYVQLAHDAHKFGLEGIVVGAPSSDNHINPKEVARARRYAGNQMLVLCPGVGAQKGDPAPLWDQGFSPDLVMVNMARELMFPKERSSAEAAAFYKTRFNDTRAAYR